MALNFLRPEDWKNLQLAYTARKRVDDWVRKLNHCEREMMRTDLPADTRNYLKSQLADIRALIERSEREWKYWFNAIKEFDAFAAAATKTKH